MARSEPLSEEQRESALKDIQGPDRSVIVPAAKALSADKSTTSRLLELLDVASHVDARHGILYALSWHADLRTWDLMVRILADPQEAPKVRGQAAEGLSYMFHGVKMDSREAEVAVEALLMALKDPSPEVRYCAVNTLGATGHLPLVPVLKEMLADQTPAPGWVGTVGEEASRALDWIERAHSQRLKDGL
ncbi:MULTISPECIES: HEAT repeat domain-containing protein [Corallococcus]|uniref:HEAT repeat domain-containing protein n=1 Tax=Corallococcus TaxID=83461 RepID=UPI0018F41A0F|nr:MULTISPECIES: HEAT repeat domain-containing protein [Corallococcus]